MPAYPHMPDPRRITGLYGGTFDPVHRGHIHVIDQLLDAGVIEQCICIPAYQNPFKVGKDSGSGAHRLAMLELVAAEHPQIYVSDIELRRAGLSYSLLTVEHFLATYGDRLRLIMGADNLPILPKWYAAERLISRVRPIIYRRPGSPLPSQAELAHQWPPALARRIADGIVDGPPCDISATAIRQALAAGKDVSSLLTPAVNRYIASVGVYPTAAPSH